MLAAAISSSPRFLWYLTRGTGVVTLVLFTLTVVLGIANFKRLETSRIPRFVVDGIHRNAALLAVTFLGVHVATTLLDSYVPIRLIDVVVPFGAAYKPLWLGLGAIAFDLLIAVALTSAMRRRLGFRTWRAVHWLAYAAWPVALIHGLGMGTDRHAHWMLLLTGGCVLLVGLAVLARLAEARGAAPAPDPRHSRERIGAMAPAAARRR
jgi:DMSO/TMAO reductase YedYZ heme-binding membrane subunit